MTIQIRAMSGEYQVETCRIRFLYTPEMPVPNSKLCFRCANRLATIEDESGLHRICEQCADKSPLSESVSFARSPARSATRAPCPFCRAKLEIGERLCVACGRDPITYDPETSPEDSSTRTCKQCNYDLSGITGKVCPECGAEIRRGRVRQHELIAEDIEKSEIRKPLWIGGISVVAWFAISLINQGLLSTALQFIGYPLAVVGLGLTYIIYSALGGGIDPPLWLIALRMAAIVPAVQLVIAVFRLANNAFVTLVGVLVGIATFAYLVVKLFDLELLDVKYMMLLHVIVWMTIQALLTIWL